MHGTSFPSVSSTRLKKCIAKETTIAVHGDDIERVIAVAGGNETRGAAVQNLQRSTGSSTKSIAQR
jgi:hypothetical protein